METFADRTKPLQTVYLVSTYKTAGSIRDEIKSLVDTNDKVLVIKIDASVWGTFNLPNTGTWLNSH